MPGKVRRIVTGVEGWRGSAVGECHSLAAARLVASSRSKGTSCRPADGYRRKYQPLSRNVSLTSVRASGEPAHCGHGTRYHTSTRASGLTRQNTPAAGRDQRCAVV